MHITRSRRNDWLLRIAGVVSIVFVWHLVTDTFGLLGSLVLPSPSAVVNEFISSWGVISMFFWSTFLASALGFVIGVGFAFVLALLLSLREDIRQGLVPLLAGGNSVPKVSLAPAIIFYVGAGFEARYLLAAWICFFPMLINTLDGISSISEEHQHLFEVLEATKWQEYKWVRLPAAVPFIFDGLKVSVVLAIVGAVVAEFIVASDGLGYLALIGARNLQPDLVIATIAVAGALSVTAFFSMYLIQGRIVHWKETELFAE